MSEPRILYRVGMHSPPLSSYPFLTRWLVRIVYFITGYQTTSHDIGIASTREKAEEMCKDSGYFYKPLYVDYPLPADQCTLGPVVWPYSEAKRWYEKHCPDPIILGKEEVPVTQSTIISLVHMPENGNGHLSTDGNCFQILASSYPAMRADNSEE